MTHARRVLLVLIATFAIGACTSLGLEPAKSFGDQLAYAYSQNTGIRQSATSALQTGAITKSDATQVLATTETARAALDEARKLGCPAAADAIKLTGCLDSASVPSTALGKLQLASGLLAQLQTFLKSRGVK